MTKETLAYENIDREFKELYVSDIKKTVVACSDPKKLDFYYAAEFRICCVFFMQQN